MINEEQLIHMVDHTLLAQTARWEEIKHLCDQAIKVSAASVCIPPCYVKAAKEYVGKKLAICTVIGFPNGYHTTAVKEFEAKQAILDGADEIDMVINICDVKNKNYDHVFEEIKSLKKICQTKVLKVIIETCLLTEEEKIKMCQLVTEAGADFIKTSTGFSTGGATVEDIKLFASHIGPRVKIKAAGGIRSFEDAQAMVDAGAQRLGTSRLITD